MNYTEYANGGISSIAPYQAGKPIEEVQRELGLSEVHKLASNENPFGMSKKAIAACKAAIDDGHFYPDSNGYALKKKLQDKFGYDPACITLGCGSNELINLLFQTFANPDVNVIIPQYSFIVYPMEATVANAVKKIIPLKANWEADTEAMLAAIDDKTRIIVLANPSNPVGTAIPMAELKDFVARVPEQVMVVIDEAYNEYQCADDYEDTALWVKDHPNLILSRTFSKAYGLAGLRVGYMVSNAEICSLINRVRAPFNVNQIALVAAVAALDDEEHLKFVVEQNLNERGRYEAFCAENGLDYIKSKANFITIDFGTVENADRINDALLHRGLIVRPIKGYGMGRYLRISIGRPEENTKLFAALKELI